MAIPQIMEMSQEDLQKMHRLQLMIFTEIDRLCRANHIKYTLEVSWGQSVIKDLFPGMMILIFPCSGKIMIGFVRCAKNNWIGKNIFFKTRTQIQNTDLFTGGCF